METEYWIIVNDEPTGPYTRSQLEQMPQLTPDTMVWYESLTDWIAASQVAALSDLFNAPVCGMPAVPPCDEIPDIPAAEPAHAVYTAAVPEAENAAVAAELPKRPGNYLAWSIISMVVFFLPLGIVALLYSIGVNRNYKRGRYERAIGCSDKAQWWIIIAIVVGLVTYPLRSILLGF